MLDKLRGLKGKKFAKQYMDDQVSAHKQACSALGLGPTVLFSASANMA
jgi:predicted outer membrane protein